MFKHLLLLGFFIFALAGYAQERPQPDGKLVHYTMSCGDYYSDGFVEGLAVDLVFSDDGEHIYISSLYPNVMPNAWHTGTIKGNKLVISCDEICYYYDYYGTGNPYQLHIGEFLFNERGALIGIGDVELEMDGDHIWLEDEYENPQHIIYVWDGDPTYPGCWAMSWCFDLKPAEQEVSETTIPATATSSDFIYYATDDDGYPFAKKGIVAVDGDDYYFTNLTQPAGVLKGTRSGNKVTLPGGQYLGRIDGYIFKAGGYESDFKKDEYGRISGEAKDVTFTVADDGSLNLDNTKKNGVAVVRADDVVYSFMTNNRVVPFTGDIVSTPKDPYEVSFRWVDDYQQYCFTFAMDNLDVNGQFLDPEKLGYYVYFDDEVYEFTPELFAIDEPMFFIPYGFVDNRDVSHELNWWSHGGKVWLSEDLFNMIGVQAVYNINGETYKSNVISIDESGSTYTNFVVDGTDGIYTATASKADCWYDLNGRKLDAQPSAGAYIQNGKVVVK